MDVHAARGLRAGASEEKIRQLPAFRDSELFDERERAALELAERMTLSGQRVDDALFARVRQHFSEDEVVELVAIAGYENMRSKMNVALGVEAQGFCVIPVAPALEGAPR
jgi:alkylhydroperoxidase family enzyme